MNRAVFWGLCAVLLFIPLPFGGVEEWAVFAFEAAVFGLFALHVADTISSRGKNGEPADAPGPTVPLWGKWLLAVFLAAAVLQLIPLPGGMLRIISPRTFEVHRSMHSGSFPELGGQGWRAVSLVPALSVSELIKYVFYFLFGWLVFNHVTTKKRIETFVLVMIGAGVFESFYGLAELFGGGEKIFGYKKVYHVGSATGTFINRNHCAGFLEMILPLSLGYLLAKADFFSFRKGMGLKDKILWFSHERLQKCIVYGLSAAVIGLGICFTRSRTGIFVFFTAVFLMAVSLSMAGGRRKHSRRKRQVRIIRTVVLVVLSSAVLIGIKPVIERFSWKDLMREQRPIYFRNTVEMIKDFPLLGTGAGSYVFVYGMYEKTCDPVLVDHAHNDYLELAAESGLVAAACLVLFAWGTLGWLWGRWWKRRDQLVRGVVLGCLVGVAAVLIHSLTDFNLRIPANAVYFVTLYALAFRVVGTKFDE